MGRETSYFDSIGPFLDENPEVVHAVYDRVNDALGDFDHLTAAEWNVLRNIFPFYAWYRAISGVTLKLAVEQPLKVNLLAQLGNIAIDTELTKAGLDREDLPSNLRGFLVTGIDPDGRVRGLNTAGVNPYATMSQLTEFVAAMASGEPGAAGRTLPGANPLAVDLLSYIFGATPGGWKAGAPGTALVEGLPQIRVTKALLGKQPQGDTLYDRDAVDELLRYLGVPYARVSPSAAKRIAAR
jgi:hypothetical protein